MVYRRRQHRTGNTRQRDLTKSRNADLSGSVRIRRRRVCDHKTRRADALHPQENDEPYRKNPYL